MNKSPIEQLRELEVIRQRIINGVKARTNGKVTTLTGINAVEYRALVLDFAKAVEELRQILADVIPYADHRADCDFTAGGPEAENNKPCSCGAAEWLSRYQAIKASEQSENGG